MNPKRSARKINAERVTRSGTVDVQVRHGHGCHPIDLGVGISLIAHDVVTTLNSQCERPRPDQTNCCGIEGRVAVRGKSLSIPDSKRISVVTESPQTEVDHARALGHSVDLVEDRRVHTNGAGEHECANAGRIRTGVGTNFERQQIPGRRGHNLIEHR